MLVEILQGLAAINVIKLYWEDILFDLEHGYAAC